MDIYFLPILESNVHCLNIQLSILVIHRVSKNVQPLACYYFDTHEWISTFFGRNVTDNVDNQRPLYDATSNNLCFCTTWQNRETQSHFSLN